MPLLTERLRRAVPDGAVTFAKYWQGRLFRGGRYALNDLDRKLSPWLAFRGGYFVELGANDGVSQSNTLYLEQRLGWRGTLVEPVPQIFRRCCTYRARTGNTVVNAACVPFDHEATAVEIVPAGLMSTALGLETDHADFDGHLASAQPGKDPRLTTPVEAPAVTLTRVLDDARAPGQPDFLSLDVEGAELAVLRGLDLARYRFRYILVECREIERLERYLAERSYRLVERLTHHDYLFADTRGE